jgi:hypothetical protein
MPYCLISIACKNTEIYDKYHLICNKYHLVDIKTIGVCLCYGKHYIFRETAYDPVRSRLQKHVVKPGKPDALYVSFLLFALAQRGIFHNRLSLGTWMQE